MRIPDKRDQPFPDALLHATPATRHKNRSLPPSGSPMKRARRSPVPLPDPSAIAEDVRYEQFFFDDATTRRLADLARRATDPLLVCLPSIAVALAQEGRAARLLDRDTRFHTLPRAEAFDIHAPHFVEGEHDLLLCDPPFANVRLPVLRATLDGLVASALKDRKRLGICYISDREEALCAAFHDYDLRPVGPPLGYRSVSADTQARIRLYLSAELRD